MQDGRDAEFRPTGGPERRPTGGPERRSEGEGTSESGPFCHPLREKALGNAYLPPICPWKRLSAPDLASFYVLTPFPGTEHYDELLSAGLITERNLDRFDATCPTWRHPHLRGAELSALLARAYREFYALPDAAAKSLRWAWRKRRSANVLLKIAVAAYSVLSRYAVARGMHPMAGGVGRVALDGMRDYVRLRRETYGLELVPLPSSLGMAPEPALSAAP